SPFLFSSRRRHTRFSRDWSSDVCSSDLLRALAIIGTGERTFSSGYTLGAIGTELDHRLEDMLDALEHLPCLTIAALSGSVYGGEIGRAPCRERAGGWRVARAARDHMHDA